MSILINVTYCYGSVFSSKAILEGDSLVVIKALTEHDTMLSFIGPWIEDAKIYSNSFCQLLSILTHTHTQGERGEGFKETNSSVYPKGLNSWIHRIEFKI